MNTAPAVFYWVVIIYALVNGSTVIWNTPFNPGGIATLTVPMHCLMGIGAAVCAICGWRNWKPIIACWAGALFPILAVDASGRLTRSILYLSFAESSTMRVGNQVMSHHEIGINFVGVILLVCCWMAGRPTNRALTRRSRDMSDTNKYGYFEQHDSQ